jgi:hypothetical protein
MAPKAKPTSVVMSECVALDHLDQVASSRVAATWTPPGSVAPLRTSLCDISRCVNVGRWIEKVTADRWRLAAFVEKPGRRARPDPQRESRRHDARKKHRHSWEHDREFAVHIG